MSDQTMTNIKKLVENIDDVDMRELLSAKDVGKGRAVLRRILAAHLHGEPQEAPLSLGASK